ncbi:ParA family protein [Oceaniglobus ichthyenteri]|uniref:ParA family protein n=1 Tax=Oceaniglobus ichthyenteri TaxID=2136177 RepID=UPI000D3B0224|nr:ParA family protein [Oceaniglobus ichthyenteri]
MPIISFANPKGGAGKTTTALILATQLAENGASVTLIDGDPERWISQWGDLPGKPDTITIVGSVSEDSIVDQIEEASGKTQFVIVDLEGTASLMVANAIGMSDLVLIPIQGSSMDARGGAKTIRLIANQAKMARRAIPHCVVFTRTSAAVRSRALRNVQEQLTASGIETCKTAIVERAAYRDLLDYGGTLSDLRGAEVSNIEKAIDNAREFAGEVVARLKQEARP